MNRRKLLINFTLARLASLKACHNTIIISDKLIDLTHSSAISSFADHCIPRISCKSRRRIELIPLRSPLRGVNAHLTTGQNQSGVSSSSCMWYGRVNQVGGRPDKLLLFSVLVTHAIAILAFFCPAKTETC